MYRKIANIVTLLHFPAKKERFSKITGKKGFLNVNESTYLKNNCIGINIPLDFTRKKLSCLMQEKKINLPKKTVKCEVLQFEIHT